MSKQAPADKAKFAEGVAYVDGEYVPIGDAKISILDWGFLHSDVTYDVTHVWKGRFFRLEDHLDRSCAALRLSSRPERIDHCGQHIVRGRNGMHVAGEMQVDVVSTQQRRLAASSTTALDTKHRPQRWIAQSGDRSVPQFCQCHRQGDRRDRRSFAQRDWIDRRYAHIPCD